MDATLPEIRKSIPGHATLYDLQAAKGDDVRHFCGTVHRIGGVNSEGRFFSNVGIVLSPWAHWTMKERRTDREALMREKEVEGTA